MSGIAGEGAAGESVRPVEPGDDGGKRPRRRPRFTFPRRARKERLPRPYDRGEGEEASWRRFLVAAIPASGLLALLFIVLPPSGALALVLGLALGALGTGALILRRLEDIAGEADVLEQENARLLAEVEARDPALAERGALRGALRRLMRREAAHTARLATLGHELRNPLAGVTGVARLLAETDQTPEQASYTQAILRASSAMRDLTDDLVEAATRPDGAAPSETARAPVRLGALVGEVAELVAPSAHAKRLDVAAFLAPSVPRLAELDARRLRQVLHNLLGNAIKYTDTGGVGLRVEHGDPGRLVVEVLDSGPGIPAERRAILFEAFQRAEETRDREGIGLGLALVARLVAEMGGRIVLLDGPDGVGLRARVTLPLIGDQDAGPMRAPRDLAGVAVHVDVARPVTSGLLRAALAERGAQVLDVPQADAIALHDLTDGPQPADAANLAARADMWAPAARHVGLLRPDQRHALEALRRAGMDGYLIAPVRPRSLVAQLRGTTGDGAAGGAGRALLAEDDAVNGLVASRLLETAGWTVVWAREGHEARRLLSETTFSALVTDLDLPGVSGEALVTQARERGVSRIVVATADTGSDPARRLADLGVDVLPKPLSRSALEDALTVSS